MKEKLLNIVAATIDQYRLLEKDGKVLVAVSGGADSMALLSSLIQLGYEVEAMHCNFHLRGEESDRDEKFVECHCKEIGIPFYCKHFDTIRYCSEHRVSIEMGARELRYAWFEEVKNEHQAQAICVAHHRQDQAETILLNLVRGTGLRGLAGMHYRNGDIIRPLLDCSRQDIEEYLHAQNIQWVNDRTNAERDAKRNIIRLDVLPLLTSINPQAIKNIANCANHIQACIPIYEKGLWAEKTVGDQDPSNETAEMRYSFESQTQLHEAIRGMGFTPTQEQNIWHAHSGAIVESATHRILKNRKDFIIALKCDNSPQSTICTKIVERSQLESFKTNEAYFDKQRIPLPLEVRKVRQGDHFIPFGMKGKKLVSDFLTDLKINRFEKERQQVLCDSEGNILWVIGRRASNLYRITENTTDVLVVSISPAQDQSSSSFSDRT